MTLLNEADAVYVGGNAASKVYLGANLVWEPAGEVEYGAVENIYPESVSYASSSSGASVSLGNRIKILTDGRITGIRWYTAELKATWLGLWKDDGTQLALEYTPVPVDTGWNIFEFATPVIVSYGQVVRVSLGHNGGNFIYQSGRLVSASPNLEWLGGVSGNGAAVDGGGDDDFPVNVNTTNNYLTDIMYQPSVDGYVLWTPDKIIDDLLSWVDPSEYDTVVLSGGYTVTAYDKASVATYGRKGASGPQVGNLNTLNYRQVFLFNNTNQGLVSDIGFSFNDFSVYAVFQKTGTSSGIYNFMVDHNYSTSWSIIRQPGTGELWGGGVIESVAPYGQYVTLAGNTGHQISSIREGTTHTIRGNGGAVIASRAESDATTGVDFIRLGDAFAANVYYSGYLGEVIVLDKALSTEDHQKVEGYLAHKWGLQAKLPANHPYLVDPPSAPPPAREAPTIAGAHISYSDGGPEIAASNLTDLLWAVEGAVTGYPVPTRTYQWRINGGSVVGTGKSFNPTGLVVADDDVTVKIIAASSEGSVEATSDPVNMVPASMTATGGTITNENRGGIPGKLHTFSASGTFTVTLGSTAALCVEIIDPGGSGGLGAGTGSAGGGSAGGRKVVTGISVSAATGAYPIVVGTGGPSRSVTNAQGAPGSGVSSAFGNNGFGVGVGGGGWTTHAGANGYQGGGGGGGNVTGGVNSNGGTGTSGRTGGNGYRTVVANGAGGGGAGMGASGAAASAAGPGAGGAGISSDFVDTPMSCGGGGGGTIQTGAGASGGAHGGGYGGTGTTTSGQAGQTPGSGGGGARLTGPSSGAGANGIVRVWYPT